MVPRLLFVGASPEKHSSVISGMLLRRFASGLAVASLGLGLAGAVQATALSKPSARGTAIVTGGGRGIGAACSRELAGRGYSVVIAYRSDAASASAVAESIRASGGRAALCQADVGRETDVVKLFQFADSCFGDSPLEVLVNNAGVLGPSGALQDTSQAALEGVLATNVAGPLLCCREAERRMSTKHGGKGGAIVQISSGSAYIGTPLMYAMSKGALNSLTIGLVKPLAEGGVRVNTVSPGMTDTEMIADAALTFDKSLIPLGRFGTPEEIAHVVCWLCSDEASYVAGANIRAAGGRPPGTTLG